MATSTNNNNFKSLQKEEKVEFEYYTDPEYVFDKGKNTLSKKKYATFEKRNDSIFLLKGVSDVETSSHTNAPTYVVYKNLLNPYEFKCGSGSGTQYINYKNIENINKVGGTGSPLFVVQSPVQSELIESNNGTSTHQPQKKLKSPAPLAHSQQSSSTSTTQPDDNKKYIVLILKYLQAKDTTPNLSFNEFLQKLTSSSGGKSKSSSRKSSKSKKSSKKSSSKRSKSSKRK